MAIGWRQPLRELDSDQHVIEPPFFRLAVADAIGGRDAMSEHPGWNITDQTMLPPQGECRYVLELASSQSVTIDLIASNPLEVLVCNDDDYDSLEHRKYWFDFCGGMAEVSSEENYYQVTFRAPSAGVYDLVVCNSGDQSADVTVRIIASAVGFTTPKSPGRETRGRERTSNPLQMRDSGKNEGRHR